jgi:predicted nucleic acid-binding protein
MKVLLNDCSVLMNLLAAECITGIAEVTGWQFAICPAVQDEVKKLRDAQSGEMVPVDIAPLITSGLLQVLELSSDEERTLYVEQSIVVDDGEAMSIAIAASRHLELAIDDKQAANHTKRTFPSIRLWSTPDILKHWEDLGRVNRTILREAIRLIEIRARYFPPKSHPLSSWWQELKEATGGTE